MHTDDSLGRDVPISASRSFEGRENPRATLLKRLALASGYLLGFLTLLFIYQQGFFFNSLGLKSTAGNPSTFENFEAGSETSVTFMMERTRQHGPDATGGFMVGVYPDGARDPGGPVYLSCFGGQGMFFSWLAARLPAMSVEEVAERSRFYVALATAAAFSLFTLFVLRRFGWTAALCFLGCTNLSVWLVFAARNIYLAFILKLVPFFLSFTLTAWSARRPRWRLPVLALALASSVLLSALCFYDYLTNTVLSLAVGPIYIGLREGWPRRRVLGWSACFIAAGAAGLILGLLLHFIKVGMAIDSFDQAFRIISHLAVNRSFGDADPARSAGDAMSMAYVWGGYWPIQMLVLPFPQDGEYAIWLSLQSFVFSSMILAALAFLDGRRFPVFEAERPKLVGLAAATAWGLLASVSWGLLMKGHMSHHFHMNGMMFSIPFLLLYPILLGTVLSTIARQLLQFIKRPSPNH